MTWGSISLFGSFLENENSLEALIVIFENVSSKGSLQTANVFHVFKSSGKLFQILALPSSPLYFNEHFPKFFRLTDRLLSVSICRMEN